MGAQRKASLFLTTAVMIIGFQNCGSNGLGAAEPNSNSVNTTEISSESILPKTVEALEEGIFLSLNGQSTDGPFQMGKIKIQIKGFSESDTYVCMDTEYNNTSNGINFCDSTESNHYVRLPGNTWGISGLAYHQGSWIGEVSTLSVHNTQRIVVKNSTGKIISKKFKVLNYPNRIDVVSRKFVNGKEVFSVEHKPNTMVEMRVFGLSQANTYYCRAEADVGTGGLLYYREACEQEHFVKLISGQQGWQYKNDYWTSTVNTSSLDIDDYYLYILSDSAKTSRGLVNIISTNKEFGFVVGPQ